jgi:hypothetical protein
MTVIRCTGKLLKELDSPPTDIVEMYNQGPLGSWHANIFRIERRKAILFTNDKTLYSLLVVGVKKANLRHFDELFRDALFKNIKCIDILPEHASQIMDETLQFILGKSNNRSVLGTMNDHISRALFITAREGGYQHIDVGDLTHRINETPTKAIGFVTCPI